MKTFNRSMFLAVAALGLLTALMWTPAAMADQDQSMGSQESEAMQTAQGARYWSAQCGRCHNLRSPGEFTDDIWDVSVNHMRIRANIPADQIRAIKTFLKSSN